MSAPCLDTCTLTRAKLPRRTSGEVRGFLCESVRSAAIVTKGLSRGVLPHLLQSGATLTQCHAEEVWTHTIWTPVSSLLTSDQIKTEIVTQNTETQHKTNLTNQHERLQHLLSLQHWSHCFYIQFTTLEQRSCVWYAQVLASLGNKYKTIQGIYLLSLLYLHL